MTLPTRILWLKIAAIAVWGFAIPTWLAIVWPPALAFADGFFDVASGRFSTARRPFAVRR